MIDWNLSEKIVEGKYKDEIEMIYIDDVAEFIKRLKILIRNNNTTSKEHWKWTEKKIDKLAGDELIGGEDDN